MWPPYITATRSQAWAITPKSWETSSIAIPCSARICPSSLRICAWVVTSSAVVGSSASISRGVEAVAIAIITRWHMPPESSCG